MRKTIFSSMSWILMIVAICLLNNNWLFAQKFEPTLESFKQYTYPEWFRDAKFGIWAHWGPQAVPRQGDWYARKMYESDIIDRKTNQPTGKPSKEYLYHLKNYGHPSAFGYKDIISLWKAERWNPEQLMKLYKKVGAKYFVSMGTHHDNFFQYWCIRLEEAIILFKSYRRNTYKI